MVFYLSSSVSTQIPCSVNGVDLSPLRIPEGGNYYTATYINGDVFTWNICGPVESGCSDSDTAVCMSSGGMYWNSGLYSTQSLNQYSQTHIRVLYTEGDTCTGISGQPQRSTFIVLVCSNDVVPVVSVESEGSCSFNLEMKTIYACASPPSPSPSPSAYFPGNSACNAIKVKSIPSTLSNNLEYGASYNSNCSQEASLTSQFYYYLPAESGALKVSTCGLTSMDTIINVYTSSFCGVLGECVASNDDGCADPTQTQSTVSMNVVKDVPYYFEVRTYGNYPAGPYSISFDNE